LSTEVLSAYASIDTAAPAPAPVQVAPKVESVAVPAAAPAAKLPEPRALERDEIATLLKRGQSLLAEGDIASARLLLRRAAEAGDAAAAMALAGTYDRAELAKLKVIGVAADHGQARHWYDKAVELGSADAVRRLQQLAQRAD
jgi:TPR repeat protein